MTIGLSDLDTPAVVVDLDRLERNLERMAEYAARHELALRPHVKTHKSPRIAAEQLDRGAHGLTCATAREAEVMAELCDDLLVAYPPVRPQTAERLVSLPEHVRLSVMLDSPQALRAIGEAARSAGRTVGVLVELDVGMRRVGVPDAAAAISLARQVTAEEGLEYLGIGFYPGHIRAPVRDQTPEIRQLSERLQATVEAMTAAGVPPRVVSGGSTPTAWQTHELAGVTEMRPGTYVYNDRTTAVIGACAFEDCALTVLATVVSTAVHGQAVIDAGSKALAREPLRGSGEDGYGVLLDRHGAVVARMSEEHGIVDLAATDWRPEVGELVRVVPNHVCPVVHLNDVVYGIRGDRVVAVWRVAARGRENNRYLPDVSGPELAADLPMVSEGV
ncbi:MAG TPA: D-TA family PLP-dependent enzyme [Gemmatimonadaceae bacterium]|nr:D-TA family PLP-dependent enzyme [Gemmatimonadaceae bacterium]